jgi:hypothetical protein
MNDAFKSAGLEELRRRERDIEARWSELCDRGHHFGGVRARLVEQDEPEVERARFLSAAEVAQKTFLADLDGLLRLQHSHFMQQVLAELDRAVETMTSFYGRLRLLGVSRRVRKLRRLADRYRELEELYGTAKDHRRIAVYQRFYAGVVAFSRYIRRLDPTAPRGLRLSLADRLYALRRAIRWLGSRAGSLGRLVIALVRIVHSVMTRKPPETGTPFTNRVDDLFRALGELRGYDVLVTGHEHLAMPEGDTTVTLYVPAHRHGVTDNVTFSHLGLPDYLVFNAVDQLPGVPRFLKQRVAETNGLIPVGGGRGSSVDCALGALASGVSRNVLIYPEGSVSEGFRGTRPPRRNFGEGLVRRLRAAGYELRLVPIAYLDNARFLDLPPVSKTAADRRLRVVVIPPLEAPVIDAVLAVGGGAMVNRMVRLAWLENLVTDDRRLLGQDRVSEVEKRLDRELDGIRYWGSLESAPVRDRLVTAGGSGDLIAVREEPCRSKRVRVLEVPESARDGRGRIRIENLADADSNELLIGIRPPSHIYLNVGRMRFDGDIFRALKVRQRDYVYPGIVIRFMNVPVKSINAIRRKLEELSGRERPTLTCANSACQVIARAANIEIDDHADLRPFLPSHVLPTRTIRKLIERGVRSHAGNTLDYQIYKTDPRPLKVILAEMRREELRIAKDHLKMITVGAWRRVVSKFKV